MIYHVLPGDSLVEEFNKTGIGGETIVCREAFVVGPIDAETPFEFWDQRARFILAEYAEDQIEFHERVADELEKLSDIESEDEVNLWFEYELFCSVNMWFCLSQLAQSGSAVFRVEPSVLSEADRWKGFGQLEPDELQRCFEARQLFTHADLKLGSDLWAAYRKNDNERLLELADSESTRFPYLIEVCKAAAEKETKPAQIIAEIKAEGITEFDEIFPEFTRRGGVYGFGDLQVQSILDQMSY
jgi:hypothetical protein